MDVAATNEDPALAPGALAPLLQTLRDHQPAIAGHEGRYTLHLHVDATSEAEALFSACARWRDAVRSLGLPRWQLARAEVATGEEFLRTRAGLSPTGLATVPDSSGGPAVDDQRGIGRDFDLRDDLLPRALQDSLTGLVNRELFADRVRSALVDDRAAGEQWAVLVLDLDAFGALNQAEGQAVGDRLLAMLASRLSRVPEHAMVARLGGDEFAVLVRERAPGDTDQVATRLLETIRIPVELGGRRVAVTASVGAATSADLSHPDDLIRDAAVAMCQAKAGGGDCLRRHEPGLTVDLRRLDFDADPAPDRLAYVLLLERAALAANECQALEDAASIVLQQVCAHTGWLLGHLRIVGGSRAWAEPTAVWHTRGPNHFDSFRRASDASFLGLGQGLAGMVLETGQMVGLADVARARGLPASMASAATAEGIRSGFAFPVLVDRDVVAVLEFYSSRRGQVNDALCEAMRGVCAQLGRVAERSWARAALARSEEKYRTLADSVPVLMWMSGSDGKVTMFNRAWLEFTGRTLEQEMTDRGVCVHPDDRARCRDAHQMAFERREPVEMDYRLRRADGEYRIIASRGQPIGSGDDFHGYVSGGIDVTDRRRAEAAVHDSEARVRALLATSGAMIIVMGADGSVIADYQGASEGMGYPEGSTSGRLGLEFVHPDDQDRAAAAFAAALTQHGPTEPFQCRVRHADGPWRWVEAVGHNLLDYPPVQAIVISALDISERKAVEERLAASEQRLGQAGDLAQMGLWHWDSVTGATWWSDEMSEILGLAPGHSPRARDFISEAVHPGDRAHVAEQRAALLSGQAIGVTDYRIVRPDGQVRWVRGRGMVLRGTTGQPVGASGTLMDITDSLPREEADEASDHTGAAGAA